MKKLLLLLALLLPIGTFGQPLLRNASTTNNPAKIVNLLPANTNPLFPISVLDPDGTGADRVIHYSPGFSLTQTNMALSGILSAWGGAFTNSLTINGVPASTNSGAAGTTNYFDTTLITNNFFITGKGNTLIITQALTLDYVKTNLLATDANGLVTTTKFGANITWDPATQTISSSAAGGSGTAGKIPYWLTSSTLANSQMSTNVNGITIAGTFSANDGSAVNPAYGFTTEIMGMYRNGIDTIGWALPSVAMAMSLQPLGFATKGSILSSPAGNVPSVSVGDGDIILNRFDRIFQGAQTWNGAGTTYKGIELTITDTASAAVSMLLDLKVGSSSLMSVSKAGLLAATSGAFTNALTLNGSPVLTNASGGVTTVVTPLAYSGTNITGFNCLTNNATYTLTLTNHCLFDASTFTGLPNTTTNVFFTLAFKQDSAGGWVPKLTNSIVAFADGVHPVIKTNANAISFLYLHSHLWTNGMLVGSANINVQ